jgi:hypothetical protein
MQIVKAVRGGDAKLFHEYADTQAISYRAADEMAEAMIKALEGSLENLPQTRCGARWSSA